MAMQRSEQEHIHGSASKLQGDYHVLIEIEYILSMLYHERKALPSSPSRIPTSIMKSGQPADRVSRTVTELDQSIERLETIKQWLMEDHHLLALVDEAINQHVRRMEQRSQHFNLQIAVATTIGGALLGWLLAVISSPQDVLRLLGH